MKMASSAAGALIDRISISSDGGRERIERRNIPSGLRRDLKNMLSEEGDLIDRRNIPSGERIERRNIPSGDRIERRNMPSPGVLKDLRNMASPGDLSDLKMGEVITAR